MGRSILENALQRLSRQAGVRRCALVDSSNGMVWHASGATSNDEADADDALWAAAADYWRLHERQKQHYARFGALRTALLLHHDGMLAVMPCASDPPLVVVAYGAPQGIDWQELERLAQALGALVHSTHDRPLRNVAAASGT